jgi:hypothetical protein
MDEITAYQLCKLTLLMYPKQGAPGQQALENAYKFWLMAVQVLDQVPKG